MRILITVKTYPTISKVHQDEFVCTAGFNENGEWVRLYPIPFRRLDYISQYKKYDWIEIDVKKHRTDWRPETYSPINGENSPINIVGHLPNLTLNLIEFASIDYILASLGAVHLVDDHPEETPTLFTIPLVCSSPSASQSRTISPSRWYAGSGNDAQFPLTSPGP
jgi:hypothetical protein